MARNPKTIIFELSIKESKDPVEQVYDQNTDFAGEFFKIFAQKFRPIYSRSNNKRSQNWVVEVHPELRKVIFDKGARVYNQWQSHRVADYVVATRCFKCQKYGHVAKYCQQNQDTCGHWAQTGHEFKSCPNIDSPAQCAPCKISKLPAGHGIGNKKCPCFLRAAKLQLTRTNYGY